MVLGITGGIASGKSLACEMLAKNTWHVIHTDKIAHDIMNHDIKCREQLLKSFGAAVYGVGGHIDRKYLGQRVFSNDKDRVVLNEIVHPLVRNEWKSQIERLIKTDIKSKIVVEIPLLFETEAEHEFDSCVTVACTLEKQIQRLVNERGLNQSEALKRIKSQWPLIKKIEKCDFLLWNEFTVNILQAQISELLRRLKS